MLIALSTSEKNTDHIYTRRKHKIRAVKFLDSRVLSTSSFVSYLLSPSFNRFHIVVQLYCNFGVGIQLNQLTHASDIISGFRQWHLREETRKKAFVFMMTQKETSALDPKKLRTRVLTLIATVFWLCISYFMFCEFPNSMYLRE